MPLSSSSPVLVTGAAGFIGYHVSQRLLEANQSVVGFDNVNDYYDPALKRARLDRLSRFPRFSLIEAGLHDRGAVDDAFDRYGFRHVVNLAAQAGVRYSKVNPYAYGDANLTGFLHVIEACRRHAVAHLVFASSSSVYGANTAMPFSPHGPANHPLSLYAATKKANEMMAHSYAHTYGLPCTGLRFFTVYGPWGRPDMAMWIFAKAILAGEPIELFNHGRMLRDFTYVDDIVESIIRLIPRYPKQNIDWNGSNPDPNTSRDPYKIYNIGNNNPVQLKYLIDTLETALDRKALRTYSPLQIGDVPETFADIADLAADVGFSPATPIEVGVGRFVDWYRDYNRI